MEKGLGYAGGSTQPSAPPPTAPPSYEEAIAQAAGASNQPITTPPYPVVNSSMPLPMPTTYNPTLNEATRQVPLNYVGQPQNTAQQAPITRMEVSHHIVCPLGSSSVKMTCPTCFADIKTTTISDHQPSAHICCIVLCLLGCCLCSCLPYCMSAFMSVHHFCPNCKNYIGTWKAR